jgi:hypothetical protein
MAETRDSGDQEDIDKKVRFDLGKDEKHHSMQPFTYLAALDLDSAGQERTLDARFCGQRLSSVESALKMNTSGHDVLSPKGRKRLKEIIAEDPHFQAPGSRFDKHKQRTREPSKGPLKKRKARAGDNLVFDFYPTGIAKTPNFAMIADGELPIGMMYPYKLKSDLVFHVQDHFSNFMLPHTLTGDFPKELHLGKNQFMCRGEAAQLRSSTPYHQWQHAGERYMFRVINMTTYVMLDAQFPEALTIHAAQCASLILMVSPVTHDGLMTTACRVYFQVDFNYNILKRQGCMVHYRLEKRERKKFGTQGSLAVLIGLNGFKFPDFTYKLYLPSNKEIIYRRDVLFAEECLPHRHGREMLGAKFDQWVRPKIGELSRSHLREAARVDLTLDGWDDGSLAVAATNLSADPTTWMDLSGGVNSPLRVADTVIVDFEECVVLNVSPAGVRVHSPDSGNVLLPPSSEFFVDSGHLMGRPVRMKHKREFSISLRLPPRPRKQWIHWDWNSLA